MAGVGVSDTVGYRIDKGQAAATLRAVPRCSAMPANEAGDTLSTQAVATTRRTHKPATELIRAIIPVHREHLLAPEDCGARRSTALTTAARHTYRRS